MAYSILNKDDSNICEFAVDSASRLSNLPACACGSRAYVVGSGSRWMYDGQKWCFQGGDVKEVENVGFPRQWYLDGMTWDDYAFAYGGSASSTQYMLDLGTAQWIWYFHSKFQKFPIYTSHTMIDCCFAPGSQILMGDGTTKNIEDIVIGDEVMSYNLHTQQFDVRKCIGTKINPSSTDVIDLTITDGTVLTMRAYHPILTSAGWKSLREYEGLPLLTEDDEIVTYTGLQHIMRVAPRYDLEGSTTYNLNIEGHEDNMVGCDNFIVNGVVAHNAGCPT